MLNKILNKFWITTNIYSKLKVIRAPQEAYSMFIQSQCTLEDFSLKLRKTFPNLSLFINQRFVNKITLKQIIQGAPIKQQIKQGNNELLKQPILDLLISDEVQFFDITLDNRLKVRLGVQILEYNQTNIRNTPDYIIENILEINQMYKPQMAIIQPFNQQLIQTTTPYEIQSLKNSLNLIRIELSQISQIQKSQIFGINKAKNLMRNILGSQILLWILLFGITYGKYGWNTGQPIAYLINLSGDLLAMAGIFQLTNSIQKWTLFQRQLLMSLGNFRSRKMMLEWRFAYLIKKL